MSDTKPFTRNRIFGVFSILLDLSPLNKPSREKEPTHKHLTNTTGKDIKFTLKLIIIINIH